MPVRPWRRELSRFWRRQAGRRIRRQENQGKGSGKTAILVPILLGALIAFVGIRSLEARLRPVLEEVARTQVVNQMTSVLEQAALKELSQQQAEDTAFVSIERDANGTITALTTDMTALNSLRAELVSNVLHALENVDVSTIQIPLGSLLDSELVWARGPAIHAQAMTVGTISAEFDSDFSAAGVNQTLYRIWLELSVPLTVILPGGSIAVQLDTRLCVAETVIVGNVPSTYLQMDSPLS